MRPTSDTAAWALTYSEKGSRGARGSENGLAALDLSVGSEVTEHQMRSLFGEGRHPDAQRLEDAALDDGESVGEAKRIPELGRVLAVAVSTGRCTDDVQRGGRDAGPSRHPDAGCRRSVLAGSDVGRLRLASKLTQPTHRRLIQAGQLDDVLDRQLLGDQPLDRGRSRDLRLGYSLLGMRALLPRDLDVDRSLVNTPLARDLIRVQLQPALPRRLQPCITCPIPTRLCLRRLTHWGPPLPEPSRRGTPATATHGTSNPPTHGSDIANRPRSEPGQPTQDTRESDDREHPRAHGPHALSELVSEPTSDPLGSVLLVPT